MFISILSIVLILISSYLLYVLKYEFDRKFKFNKYLSKMPAPPGNFLFGNALEFASSTKILPVLMKYQNQYKSNFVIRIGPSSYRLICTDVKLLELLLSSQKFLKKTFAYRFLYSWLRTGLLTSTGSKWRQRRRIITPSFHLQILQRYVDVFEANGDVLIKKLEKESTKPSVNIQPYIKMYALDNICETAMGTSVNAQNNSDNEYIRSVKEILRIIIDRSVSLVKTVDFLYRFSEDYYKEQNAIKVLHDYTDYVINSRKNDLKKQSDDSDDCSKKVSFLDLLLKTDIDGKPLAPEDIKEEVATFMFAGHDTTTSAISFTLFCLTKYQDIQRKVVEELKTVFGGDKYRPATYNDLQNMKYLEQVIKESLRLYPPAPFFAREIEEDIQYGEHILHKGLPIVMFAYAVHRDPNLYLNPEKFDPERFTPENCAGRPSYAYIPFSAGPRSCIGQKFAMLEIKSVVTKILRNFELHPTTPEHEMILAVESILISKNGVVVRLKKRD